MPGFIVFGALPPCFLEYCLDIGALTERDIKRNIREPSPEVPNFRVATSWRPRVTTPITNNEVICLLCPL